MRLLGSTAFILGGLVCAAGFPAPNPVATPGEWTRITDLTGRNIDEIALARAPDGRLHAAWVRKSGTRWDVVHVTLDSTGRATAGPDAIVTSWGTVSDPYLLAGAQAGLRAFFGGVRDSAPGDRYDGSIYMASAGRDGAWRLSEHAVVMSKNTHIPGVTLRPDGTPVITWANGALTVHVGLDPSQQDQKFQTACCAYLPQVATDAASGETVLAWYSNATSQHGLSTQTILPTAGAAQFAPGSATPNRASSQSASQRVALSGRIGAPGVYLAYCAGYPTCETINLLRHGATAPLAVATAHGARHVNIAAGPEGRLWVMWMEDNRVYATRTNKAATRVGPVVTVAPPAGTSAIWKVKGDGTVWPLDLFAAVTTGDGLATWHTQVLPGLSVSASPARFTSGTASDVSFTVTDAGDPVEGADVTVAGETLHTDAQGHAHYAFPAATKPGKVAIAASRSGYRAASAALTVEPPPPPPKQ
jgi:hypothetical protein